MKSIIVCLLVTFACFQTESLLAQPGVPVLTLTPECSGTTSQIRLNWTAASGATSYDVYRNFAVYITGLTGTQFINTAVTPGTTYSYSVLARNSSGQTGSATQSATAPSCSGTQPGAFTLTLTPECDGSTSQIRLNCVQRRIDLWRTERIVPWSNGMDNRITSYQKNTRWATTAKGM